ncbi:MAG TPA: hypothetical protein VFW98_03115 [Gemmatimonadaceae bacterium]|nr:hypothetical protein [Gemmatimonadaceae bacterium]
MSQPRRAAVLAWWLAREAPTARRVLALAPTVRDTLTRRRLRWTLAQALRTPWYGERLRDHGIDAGRIRRDPDPAALLAALPPVGKEQLRAAGTGVLAGGRAHPLWFSSRSSGSTGEPFRVHYDPRAWAMLKHLVKLRARAACGVRARHRIALLDAISVEEEGRSLAERTGRMRRVSVLAPPEHMADVLAAFRPHAIYGLPTALAEAGRVLCARGQALPCTRVFTSGELLSRATREAIARAYSARVFDVYGSSETKEIAWECTAGSMHVNSDVVWLEVLDDDGAPAAAGTVGAIVVTLLVNRAMPLLRYRVGDRGSVRVAACGCGLTLPQLGVVTGRDAETLELSGGRRVSPYTLTMAVERVPGVLRFQVRQLAPDRLLVQARLDASVDAGAAAACIRREIAAAIPGAPPAVDVERVEQLDTTSRGKARVVQPLGGGSRERADALPSPVDDA